MHAYIHTHTHTFMQGLRTFQLILVSLNEHIKAISPKEDPLCMAIARLESEFSTKFYSKLYK